MEEKNTTIKGDNTDALVGVVCVFGLSFIAGGAFMYTYVENRNNSRDLKHEYMECTQELERTDAKFEGYKEAIEELQ